MKYYQCRLSREHHDHLKGLEYVFGWIPEHGAKKGAIVELKEFGENFKVEEVFSFSINKKDLDKMNTIARTGFESVERTK